MKSVQSTPQRVLCVPRTVPLLQTVPACVCVWWGEPLLCLLCCDIQDHCKGLGTGTLAGSFSATGPTSRVVPANGWIAVSGLNQKAWSSRPGCSQVQKQNSEGVSSVDCVLLFVKRSSLDGHFEGFNQG